MKNRNSNSLFISGVLTAFTASLCCITPILALLAGTSGIASTFSWLEPFRPWLIGFTLVVLGFAWHQKLNPKKTNELDCECKEDEKPVFWQSKRFLAIVTLFAVAMLAFPTYTDVFFPRHKIETAFVDKNNIHTAEFRIDGMTCTGCEAPVEHEISQLIGIITAKASFENGNATVKFDNSLTSIDSIKAAIKNTGYQIHSIIEIQ